MLNPEPGTDGTPTAAAASQHRPWLHALACLWVLATFVLIVLGGTVTSKGVGMSVPDWPTTYGYNMFLFPPHLWQGGIFWEHSHRLMGSLVGFITIGICVSLWITQKHRPWLKRIGAAALVLVIIQGIMGGLRVTQFSITLAIFHGITAQLFLCLTVLVAAATGKHWQRITQPSAVTPATPDSAARKRVLQRWAVGLLAVLVLQLSMGAAMRHTASGLAIPDFPRMYGQWLPPTSDAEIEAGMIRFAAQHDTYVVHEQHFTLAQVYVHLAHRIGAAAVVLVALVTLVRVLGTQAGQDMASGLKRPAIVLAAMLAAQVLLGMAVIWTGRHPEMATAHQSLGAATLATAFLMVLRLSLVSAEKFVPARSQEDVLLESTLRMGVGRA